MIGRERHILDWAGSLSSPFFAEFWNGHHLRISTYHYFRKFLRNVKHEKRVASLGGSLELPTDESRQLEVWIDGECALCLKSRAWCEARDRHRHLSFNDIHSADESGPPVGRLDLESSMWVRDGSGNLVQGFAAWRRIMGVLPRWRWLARLASLPPLTLVGPTLYRLVAANRGLFGG